MNEILVVDDNAANLDLLGRLLRERGYKVRVATSGSQALASARLGLPDLILLDINMPDLDGYQTCEKFKAEPGLAAVPIIFLSALDDPQDKVRAFTVGGEDYITKPFQAEEVLSRIKHQLRIASLQRDLLERNRCLELAYAELKDLNEQKNQFFGIVAHDLRNPLSGIVLEAQMLEEEEDLARVHVYAGKIVREGMEMSALIGRFLNIAAIESGKVKPEPELFDVRELVKEVTLRHGPHGDAKGIALMLDLPAAPVYGFVDRKFLAEVVDNLVSNGVKFSPPGRPVRIAVAQGEQLVRVSVQDEGPGFTEEDRARLFGRFARLGLSIVKNMVDAMGGRVWVESEPGKGAEFRVEVLGHLPASSQ